MWDIVSLILGMELYRIMRSTHNYEAHQCDEAYLLDEMGVGKFYFTESSLDMVGCDDRDDYYGQRGVVF